MSNRAVTRGRSLLVATVSVSIIYLAVVIALLLYAYSTENKARDLAAKLQQIRVQTSTRGDVEKLLGHFTASPMGGSYGHQQDGFSLVQTNYPQWLGRWPHFAPFRSLMPVYPTEFSAGIYFEGDRVSSVLVYYMGRDIFVRTEGYNLGGLAPEVHANHWNAGEGVTVDYDQNNSDGMQAAWAFNFDCMRRFHGCAKSPELLAIARLTP